MTEVGAMNDRARGHFHALWSESAGQSGYDKRTWLALEAQLFGPVGWSSIALTLAKRLREVAEQGPTYDAAAWDELERLVFG